MKLLGKKTLFWIVLLVAIIEGIWIYFSHNLIKRISMSPYSFNDSVDGLVTAEGSWISPIKLAFPLSSVKIECWRDFGYCWFADGTIMDNNYLSVGLDLKEIEEWTDEYIQTKPSKPLMGCVEESYRLDRRSQVVTYTRRTVDTADICEGVSEEPIVAKLGDGYERIKLYKDISN